MGILYFFTIGLFGIGWIVDIIILIFKPKSILCIDLTMNHLKTMNELTHPTKTSKIFFKTIDKHARNIIK